MECCDTWKDIGETMREYSLMIIDDDETDRYIIKRRLSVNEIGSQVFEKQDGQDALDFLSDRESNLEQFGAPLFPPKIIFLDVNMPRMNGFEFLAEFETFAHDSFYKDVKFLMLSSSENPMDKQQASDCGYVHGYINKSALLADSFNELLLPLLPKE